jgi:hypothetical protein
MLKGLQIILVFCILPIYAAKEKPILGDSETLVLTKEMHSIYNTLSTVIDSLQDRVKYLEIRHGLFDTEFKNSTAVFSLIVGIALTFYTAFAFVKLQSEKKEITNNLNQKLSEFKKELTDKIKTHDAYFEAMQNKINISELRLNHTTANSYITHANIEVGKKMYINAVLHYAAAAAYNFRALNLSHDAKREKVLATLKTNLFVARKTLESIPTTAKVTISNDTKTKVFDYLDEIFLIDDEAVRNMLSEIRTKMSKIEIA